MRPATKPSLPAIAAGASRSGPRRAATICLAAALAAAAAAYPVRAAERVIDETDPGIRYFGSSPWHKNGVQAYALRGTSWQGWAYTATARTVSMASFINWNGNYDSLDLHVWVDPPGFDGTQQSLPPVPHHTFHIATLESAPGYYDEGFWARRLDILDFGSVQTHTVVVAISNRKNGAVDNAPAAAVEISLGAILLDAASFSRLPPDATAGTAPGPAPVPASGEDRTAAVAVSATVGQELLMSISAPQVDFGTVAPSRSPATRAAAVTVTVRANIPWTLRHALAPLTRSGAADTLLAEYRQAPDAWRPLPPQPAAAAEGPPTAGQTHAFDLRLHVPYTAPPGTYRGSLVYEVLPR